MRFDQVHVGFFTGVLAALGFIALGAAGARGTFAPAVLVVVGSAATILIITWIIARTAGSLDGTVNFRAGVDRLHQRFADAPPGEGVSSMAIITSIMEEGVSLVPEIIPARAVAVFVHDRGTRQFTALASWQADPATVVELAQQAELVQALRANAPVVSKGLCAVPVGFCPEGALMMAVRRPPAGRRPAHPAHQSDDQEPADRLAAAFLQLTSRVNFMSGLRAESRTDPLTGLANRRSLYERIEMEMAHALRHETPLSVAMIDLDHFRAYNDAYGHVAGDTLLRSISAIMVSNIRGQDMVARYGGEEFCLVMPDTDLVGGHNLLETLRTGGRDSTSELAVTLSAGLTSWDGIEDTTSFIERADQALDRAKGSGRNRVVSIQSFTEF